VAKEEDLLCCVSRRLLLITAQLSFSSVAHISPLITHVMAPSTPSLRQTRCLKKHCCSFWLATVDEKIKRDDR